MSKHKPPKNVISAYLPFINNSELRLYLAQKHQCHKFIIQTYINQDDRLALIKYKTSVPVTSEEFILIEEVLHSVRKRSNVLKKIYFHICIYRIVNGKIERIIIDLLERIFIFKIHNINT